MSEEYNLRKSTVKVGELYPVLKSKTGEIIDGFHRKNAKAGWREEVREDLDTPEKILLARLIANKFRRTVEASEVKGWINDLAEMAVNDYGIKPGEISGWVSSETGYSERQVRFYLDDKYKEMKFASAIPKEAEATATSVELDTVDALGSKKYEELRKSLKQDPDFQREVLEEIQRPKTSPDALRDEGIKEVARELAVGVREGLLELDRDIKKAAPALKQRNNLTTMETIQTKLQSRQLYNPFNPESTLVWNDGHTLEETIAEMQRRVEQ